MLRGCLAASVGLACAPGPQRGEAWTSTGAVASGSGGSSDSSGSESGERTSTTGGDDSPGPKFDLGEAPLDASTDADEGCRNIDFLFVIDNSASMDEEQAALVAAFPGFVEGVGAVAETAESFHIGVVTTDEGPNPSPCRSQGALLTRGTNQSSCPPFVEGGAYLTEDDPLDHHFACIAEVGTSGSDEETPLTSMDIALSPPMNAEGACNAGFARPDSLWVITFITDENDQSPDEVEAYLERLLEVRGHDETSVVVLALVDTEHDVRLTEFTQSLTYGAVGDIGTEDYAEFFTSSLSGIGEACSNLGPAG